MISGDDLLSISMFVGLLCSYLFVSSNFTLDLCLIWSACRWSVSLLLDGLLVNARTILLSLTSLLGNLLHIFPFHVECERYSETCRHESVTEGILNCSGVRLPESVQYLLGACQGLEICRTGFNDRMR